jgi:Zn-dependent peptidase ImmA (M78 family)/transcriptional regulator with XRE-family HTH domain
MDRPANHEMVTLAREARGMTQAKLAERSGLSQPTISKIEHGLLELADEHINAFSHALGYPPTFFLRSEHQYGAGTVCHHRKRQSMPIQKLRQIHATMNIMRMATADLLRGIEIDAQQRFPRMDADDYGSVEEIAQLMRRTWQLPLGPIKNLVMSIEAAGGLVVPCDFGTDKLDAISQRPANQPPFFFVSASAPGDRLRWNLAHELGHIVMHDAPAPDQESEANRFAAEFLLPGKEIRPELEGLTLPKLAELKRYWKVAMQALIMRAHDLGTISERQKRSFFTRFSQLGYRRAEPVTIAREEPTLIGRVVDFHRTHNGYTDADLSRAARLSLEDFKAVYGATEAPRLRLVP